jgi:signal transduction histidine kinase
LCFYRVAQEALSNSVKHSGATRIDVRLIASDGLLRMMVKDDGSGFDPAAAANGLGLATMRERLRLVDGNLLVNSMPGRGTEITAQTRLDLSATKAAAA